MYQKSIYRKVINFFVFFASTRHILFVFLTAGLLVLCTTTLSSLFQLHFGNTYEKAVNESIPIMIGETELAAQSSKLAASVSSLVFATSQQQLHARYQGLAVTLGHLLHSVARIRKRHPNNPPIFLSLRDHLGRMQSLLAALETSTGRRLAFAARHAQIVADLKGINSTYEHLLSHLGNERGGLLAASKRTQALPSGGVGGDTAAFVVESTGSDLLYIISQLDTVPGKQLLSSLQAQYSKKLSRFIKAAFVFTSDSLARRHPDMQKHVREMVKKFVAIGAKGPKDFFQLCDQELADKKLSLALLGKIRQTGAQLHMDSEELSDHTQRHLDSLHERIHKNIHIQLIFVSIVSGGSILLIACIAIGTILTLGRKEKELEQANEMLEARVASRTRELQKSYQQLAHAGRLAALGEMSTSIAHELNQPLAIIKLAMQYLEMTGDGLKAVPMVADGIKKVLLQVDRATSIIDNMRTFARASEDKVFPFSLAEGIRIALSFFQEQFRAHDIILDLCLAENLPSVRMNPQKFEQVIVNLLANARYAVDAKQAAGEDDYAKRIGIRLRPGTTPGSQVVEVSDNGTGMSEETRQRCMESFFTTKESGSGTGLGLAISRNIVKELGGHLTVESSPEQGSIFRISFSFDVADPATG